MISPRRTRLVRAADLRAFRDVITRLSLSGGLEQTRSRLVVVPTRGAARQLRRTIENHALGARRAIILPDLVTRDQLYDGLWARLPNPPRRLTAPEREAMVRAAAEEARAEGAAPPFPLRPRLVAEAVRFYDELRRQRQSVGRFEELAEENLARDIELDRGAVRMLGQTRFLAATYRGYERRRASLARADEHALRDRLLEEAAPDPVRHLVVTVGDWIADQHGLYRADFDLLTRLPGLETIDLVATEELLASGFHARVHDWLPGVEEVDQSVLGVEASPGPVQLVPAGLDHTPAFVSRDREEELAFVARRIKQDGRSMAALDRTAVVFKRPLPYLYLAPAVFGGARIPYQTADALPLAAEPFAAALDLVLELVASGFTRRAIVALIGSAQFAFAYEGRRVSRRAVAALDRALSERRYLGEIDRLRQISRDWDGDALAAPALAAALAAAEALYPLVEGAPASIQFRRLQSFLTSHTPSEGETASSTRARRARTAVVGILEALAAASGEHDDRPVTIEAIAPEVRRWIGEQTFVPETGAAGLHVVDEDAARYGDFDEATIIGVIEGEWPERQRRNIFYPSALLAGLGWPSEKDRRSAAVARFIDLVRSPSRRVAISTFTLDDDALVEPSSLVDDLERAGLAVVEIDPPARARVFKDEALSMDPPAIDVLDETARAWALVRLARTSKADDRFHGQAGLRPSSPLSVTAIETYLACPFKFFAQYVLRLAEEPDDEEVMDPKRQGQFLHLVFERFFAAWQEAGHGAITPASLDAARVMFAAVAEEHLARLPNPEAALERHRLVGSSVAEGLAEAVFRMEAERPIDIVERLLEYRLDGELELDDAGTGRRVALRGVADRLDLLADGTIRVIDYKLSSPPPRSRALQLPIYGLCAEQRLRAYRGRSWKLGEAAYISFRGPKRVEPLFTNRADRGEVLKAAQRKLVGAVDGIERGSFPPMPDEVFLCGSCSFATVCRKDYVDVV